MRQRPQTLGKFMMNSNFDLFGDFVAVGPPGYADGSRDGGREGG